MGKTVIIVLFHLLEFREAIPLLWQLFGCTSVQNEVTSYLRPVCRYCDIDSILLAFIETADASPNRSSFNDAIGAKPGPCQSSIWLGKLTAERTARTNLASWDSKETYDTDSENEDPSGYFFTVFNSTFLHSEDNRLRLMQGLHFDEFEKFLRVFVESLYKILVLPPDIYDLLRTTVLWLEHLPMSITKVQGRLEVIFYLAHQVQHTPSLWNNISNIR